MLWWAIEDNREIQAQQFIRICLWRCEQKQQMNQMINWRYKLFNESYNQKIGNNQNKSNIDKLSKSHQLIGNAEFLAELIKNYIQSYFGQEDVYNIQEMYQSYDLVIVGAGCMGIAAAYYAMRKNIKSICIIQRGKIGSDPRYWSSSFSAEQNRVQYNQEYLTRFAMQSNEEWIKVQKGLKNDISELLLHKEGALWFGNKNTTTNEGNIKTANSVITLINSQIQDPDERLESLYIEKLMTGCPEFMKAFRPVKQDKSTTFEWDSWSALYQPDGGSVNMKATYHGFLRYVQRHGVVIKDQAQVKSHLFVEEDEYENRFIIAGKDNSETTINCKKVLLSVGVHTPFFLERVLHDRSLDKDDYSLQQYVTSYIKIKDCEEATKLYQSLPNYYNFLKGDGTLDQWYSGYGFRYHEWDNIQNQSKSKFVKVGTMASKAIGKEELKEVSYTQVDPSDRRVSAVKRFVSQRMKHLDADYPENVHYPCPIIFYSGLQTMLDYLHRQRKSFVVQSGGWIGKYFPLLAKTAITMLFEPKKTEEMRLSETDVIGNFINRTRFPIRQHVINKLQAHMSSGIKNKGFNTMIIGAGCSGLYSAFRLNDAKKQEFKAEKKEGSFNERIGKIGVFELSERISGRLKSFYFKGISTPMQLGGMRYIQTSHALLNRIIKNLGVPYIKFQMNGDPIQDHACKAYLRNNYYNMDQWSVSQNSKENLHTAYRIDGPIMGMDAFQIISFSLYMILVAPENLELLKEVFLEKTDLEISQQKEKIAKLGQNVPYQSSYYRTWQNYVREDPNNPKVFYAELSLLQWNKLKPNLLFRFRFPVKSKDIYKGQQPKKIGDVYPLYKFGFQNVIEAQFGHEAYQFVAEQNGYFANTSNASYLDQVMDYVLDFGSVSYHTLAGGFDQINYSMANALLDEKQGFESDQGIFLSHKLVDILPGYDGYKYTAVFHIPKLKQDRQTYQQKWPDFCKTTRYFLGKGEQHPLGRKRDIEGTNYEEVRYGADRIIFGMPKKSVGLLISEVEMLRKPIDTYLDNYASEKQKYYNMFNYPALNAALKQASKVIMTPEEKEDLSELLQKQEKSYTDPKEKLSKYQKKRLEKLSQKQFLLSLQPITDIDFESKKVNEIFEKDPPIAPKDLRQLSDTAQIMPAMKIVFNFDRNWWDPNYQFNKKYQQKYKTTNLVNSVENMRGVSVTDLPIRQTLYFAQGEDNLLLGSYNDMITTEFWTTLHKNFNKVWTPTNKRIQEGFANRCIQRKIGYPPYLDIQPAKQVLVKEILKQLSLVHQLEVQQEWVKECIYQFWGDNPYGGGYHNFYSGYYIPAVMKTVRKPWQNENLHIVGEAYSNETGWVQGTFQTCQRLLQEQLNLSPLVQDYYAGY